MDWSSPVKSSSKLNKPVDAVRANDNTKPACDAVVSRVKTMMTPVAVTRRLAKLRITILNPHHTD
jgi:hypothetical protein